MEYHTAKKMETNGSNKVEQKKKQKNSCNMIHLYKKAKADKTKLYLPRGVYINDKTKKIKEVITIKVKTVVTLRGRRQDCTKGSTRVLPSFCHVLLLDTYVVVM